MAMWLRLPPELKERIEKLAEAQGRTAHAVILDAIREKLDADELRAPFHAEATRRLARMKKSGMGIPATEVMDYMRERARGGRPVRPRPRKTA